MFWILFFVEQVFHLSISLVLYSPSLSWTVAVFDVQATMFVPRVLVFFLWSCGDEDVSSSCFFPCAMSLLICQWHVLFEDTW